MYYTLLFLYGLLFWNWGGAHSYAQAQTSPCLPAQQPLTLKQRLELQTAEWNWQVFQERPIPLWAGFSPAELPLLLSGSACQWYISNLPPPPQSETLPDFKKVYRRPSDFSRPESEQIDSAQQDLPQFCRPLATAFRTWGQNAGLFQLDALGHLAGLESSNSDWQRELASLEKALQTALKPARQDWLKLFFAARHQRFAQMAQSQVEQEQMLERLLGLEAWICLRQEETLSQTELPEELKHLGLFRNPVMLMNFILERSQQGLTEIERLRQAGLLQVLLLEQIFPDWQSRLQKEGFAPLLGRWSAYTPTDNVLLTKQLHQHFPEKKHLTLDPRVFEKQQGFLFSLELPQVTVDLHPQQLLGLSEYQFLLLPGSQVQIRHPQLWGNLRGLTRITALPGETLKLEFFLPLRAYLRFSENPASETALVPPPTPLENCQDLQVESPGVSLWGRCLQGQISPQGYTLSLK